MNGHLKGSVGRGLNLTAKTSLIFEESCVFSNLISNKCFRYTCDAIQQKVHKVRKLVFLNAMEISGGDRKEHKKKSRQLMHVKSSYDVLNL